MNERIKQLWEQAAKTTQGDSWEEQTQFMEKFAQLIIEDCIQIVHTKTDDSIKVVFDIETHFGLN